MTNIPPSVFAVARRVFFPGALACAALLLLAVSLGARAQNEPAPNCADLGGETAANAQICFGVDEADTFCVIDSQDALPCRGLFTHVRQCNDYKRPALNPFLCAAACGDNEKALGKACGVQFGEHFFANAEPSTVGISDTVDQDAYNTNLFYYGKRRGLHYAYFSENLGNQGFPTEGARSHADYCALGRRHGGSLLWRPPTLAEAIALISDLPDATVGQYDGIGAPPLASDTVLRDVFSVRVPPCAEFSADPTSGDTRACADAEALNPGNNPVAAGFFAGDMNTPPFPHQALMLPHPAADGRLAFFTFEDIASNENISNELIIPCVLPVDDEHIPTPNPAYIAITPSGERSSFPGVEDPKPEETLAYLSYAAPDSAALQRDDPLFTVTVLARRLAAFRYFYSTVAFMSVSINVRVGRSEFSYEDEGDENGEVRIPVQAGTVISPSPPFFLTVAILAKPEVGPERRAEFLFANIPVVPPPRADVTVLAAAQPHHATLAPPPEMAEEPDAGSFSVVDSASAVSGASFSFSADADNNTLLTRNGPLPTEEDGERILVEFTHPRLRGALTLTVYFHPPSSSARAADSRGVPVALGGNFSVPGARFPPLSSGWGKRRGVSRNSSGEVAGGLHPIPDGSGIPAAFRGCCR